MYAISPKGSLIVATALSAFLDTVVGPLTLRTSSRTGGVPLFVEDEASLGVRRGEMT
jgi:hypothetical protein